MSSSNHFFVNFVFDCILIVGAQIGKFQSGIFWWRNDMVNRSIRKEIECPRGELQRDTQCGYGHLGTLVSSDFVRLMWFLAKETLCMRRTSSFCLSCTKWLQILRPALLWTMKIAKIRLGTRIRSDPRHQKTQGVLGLFPTRPCMTDVVYLRATVLAINKHWEPSNPMASKLDTFLTLTRLARYRCYRYEKVYRPD